MNQKSKAIYLKASELWGRPAQIGVAIEEMGELLSAIQKYNRGRATVIDVCDEIADVSVVCEQLSLIYGESIVKERKQYKIGRLAKRLDKAGKELKTA